MTRSFDDAELTNRVVQLSRQGMSRRAIARALKIGRNRVRRLLILHGNQRRQGHTVLPRPKSTNRRSKLDAHEKQMTYLLKRFPGITAQRVFEELKAKGFTGSVSLVRQRLRTVRPKAKQKVSLITPTYEPGAMAESDWSSIKVTFANGEIRTYQFFAYVLWYSRRKCFSVHQRCDLHALMDGHLQAFERLGGTARQCKYDNQKPVVLRWEGGQAVYNPRFVDFATYYEFQPVACRPYHPNDKPRVERSFWELTRSFFNGREFATEEDLCRQLKRWMQEVSDQRYQRDLRCRVIERFEIERPHLSPLPEHPYDTARVVYRVCDIEGCINWDGNRYEVPYDWVTDLLPVRISSKELTVYSPELKLIATHELRRKGAGERAELVGRKRPGSTSSRGAQLDKLRSIFETWGDKALAYLKGLENRESCCSGYHARKILALRERYATEDIVSALAHALHFEAFDYAVIERILTSRAPARRLDEYVAEPAQRRLKAVLGESTTEPRSLEEYDALPCARETGDNKCRESHNRAKNLNETTSNSVLASKNPSNPSE